MVESSKLHFYHIVACAPIVRPRYPDRPVGTKRRGASRELSLMGLKSLIRYLKEAENEARMMAMATARTNQTKPA
jgi:hypothetical protein